MIVKQMLSAAIPRVARQKRPVLLQDYYRCTPDIQTSLAGMEAHNYSNTMFVIFNTFIVACFN